MELLKNNFMSNNYNRKDQFYKSAKESGYRSRAFFKLKEMDKKYKLFKRNDSVLDLGAWPGSWLEYTIKAVGNSGLCVGADLVEMKEFPENNVHCVTGDLRDESTIEEILSINPKRFDSVISDMSPKLTGIKEADRAGAIACAELAFWLSEKFLKPNGIFLTKVFKSEEANQFFRDIRKSFDELKRSKLDSTRKTSNEFYIIGIGYKG